MRASLWRTFKPLHAEQLFVKKVLERTFREIVHSMQKTFPVAPLTLADVLGEMLRCAENHAFRRVCFCFVFERRVKLSHAFLTTKVGASTFY